MSNKGKQFSSQLKLHSDYFKWLPSDNRYETWSDAAEDIINGHKIQYQEYPDLFPYLDRAQESLKDMGILASQRNLQYRWPQINRSNLRMYNCVTTHAMRNRVFQEVFYLALNGCGVGVGLLKPFVKNISRIQKRKLGTKTFVIEDSIEGWADALGVLMSSFFVDKQPFPEYAGYEVKFDGSNIREKGSFIAGGFKAPGFEPLRLALENVERLLINWIEEEGDELRPIAVGDIICFCSDAVLSGGVRRAAFDFIVDPYDMEMIMSKTGDWYVKNRQRERTNNSVLFIRSLVTKEEFQNIVRINEGMSDIGFAFANSWFDMFNPCFEISQVPVLYDGDVSKIHYDDIFDFVRVNEHLFGVQGCNLNEILAEKCTSLDKFLRYCEDATVLGTCQAGYTDFPYLGKVSEEIFKREALLGVSIIGWMNNPKMFNAEWLQKGAQRVKDTNAIIAPMLDLNISARTTTVKPGGNSGEVAMTEGGMKAVEAARYFRVQQINKENTVAKYMAEHMPYMIEDSTQGSGNTDYVIYIPVEAPKGAILKKDILGVKHLELIKLVQENWVIPGTNPDRCAYKGINHNVSCTVVLGEGDKEKCIEYIWENKDKFTAISFLDDNGSREYNQAPFTEVNSLEDIVSKYGVGSIFAAGLIVDGLHYFKEDLWTACKSVLDKTVPISGTKEDVLLKKYWIARAKKFAKNYFKGNLEEMIYCLKDVHILHKWETIDKQFKGVDFSKILTAPEYKNVSDYGAIACAGNACTI